MRPFSGRRPKNGETMELVNYGDRCCFNLILTTTIGFVELIGSLIVKLAK